jgi:uncharacterized protein (TIGR01777 family)
MSENHLYKNIRNNSSVLITGGSGLIGRYLTSRLLSEGYTVAHLSRKQDQFGKVRVHRWDPEKMILAPSLLEGVDCIIHLAGANIGGKRWSKKRKEEILQSRIGSANLLYRTASENGIKIKTFITASAIGYYGSATSDNIYKETDPPFNDFLGNTCRLWEEAADQFKNTGARVVKIRTGVVMEKNDSALAKIMMPAKSGFLVQTGNGRQYMPWIHIKDICNIYLKAIEDKNMIGSYNAVAPQHTTHKEFIKTLAGVTKSRLFPIPVPALIIRIVLGEMSDVVLKGSRISSEKISESNYNFIFKNLDEALRDVLK